jgi:hypothetical protein
MYRLDEGVVGSGVGLFPHSGPLAEDSAAKLTRSQLNVCTFYCVPTSPPPAPPPAAEIVPDWPAISVSS